MNWIRNFFTKKVTNKKPQKGGDPGTIEQPITPSDADSLMGETTLTIHKHFTPIQLNRPAVGEIIVRKTAEEPVRSYAVPVPLNRWITNYEEAARTQKKTVDHHPRVEQSGRPLPPEQKPVSKSADNKAQLALVLKEKAALEKRIEKYKQQLREARRRPKTDQGGASADKPKHRVEEIPGTQPAPSTEVQLPTTDLDSYRIQQQVNDHFDDQPITRFKMNLPLATLYQRLDEGYSLSEIMSQFKQSYPPFELNYMQRMVKNDPFMSDTMPEE